MLLDLGDGEYCTHETALLKEVGGQGLDWVKRAVSGVSPMLRGETQTQRSAEMFERWESVGQTKKSLP